MTEAAAPSRAIFIASYSGSRGNLYLTRESNSLFSPRNSLMTGPAWSQKLRDEIGKAVIGQDAAVERLLVALLANGHVLLEGMPGLAKTLLDVRRGCADCRQPFNDLGW